MGDRLERRLVAIVPYALLGVMVVVTAAIRRGDSRLIDLALCTLAAAWMLGGYTLRPAWRDRPSAMTAFMAGLIAIMAVLVVRDPWFGLFTPAAYLYAFRVLRWPVRLVGVAAVAVVAGTAQASGVSLASGSGIAVYAAVLAVNVLPMCGLAWVDRAGDERSDRRERTLDDVREVNRRLAETLAENAALQERLVARAREAGVLDERQRMAREIHDTLAQGLTGIVTQLQAAEQAADDPDAWRRHVGAATRLARESLSEARRSVDALRPEPLESARLDDALAAVASRWSALHGIPVEVTTAGTPRPLATEAEVALLRTAQEALANAGRHAAATRISVALSYRADEVVLDVRDDGRGFDVDADRPAGGDGSAGPSAGGDEPVTDGHGGGFGLVAMRQRVEERSGTLRIESAPGAGTAISVRVPTVPDPRRDGAGPRAGAEVPA
jgi:signal transduction histidine kinase